MAINILLLLLLVIHHSSLKLKMSYGGVFLAATRYINILCFRLLSEKKAAAAAAVFHLFYFLSSFSFFLSFSHLQQPRTISLLFSFCYSFSLFHFPLPV